uniref:Protein HGV2 n=1 Tax=Lygus hesperus TaxID=30085 RepID=A0A0A9XS59_LYGHE
METTSDETTASPTVECTQEGNDDKEVESEALAKVEPLTTDNEKMELSQSTSSSDVSSKDETNAKPTNSTVTGSDDVTQAVDGNAQEDTPKKEENTSADSTSEQEPTEAPESSGATSDTPAGSSSTSETQPDVQNKIDELKKQGLAFFIQKNFCAAADSFGKLLEVQAPLYGEMSEKLAETYFLYGSAMYEYGKTENTVLGEKVPQKDEEEDDDEEEDTEEGDEDKMEEGAEEKVEEGAEDKMEVEETPAVNGKDEKLEELNKEPESSSQEKQPADESLAEEDKEDDEAFRVAWEMLELAKATFEKGDNKKRLADTFMKLGELGIETGNPEAISEMVKGLNVRKELYKDNNRIIPETHFTIGVAYAFFEKYDEAVEHFKEAKKCLEDRIEALSKSEGKDDLEEVEEMKKILPEIQDKIQDTLESKADHEKLKEKQAEEVAKPEVAPFPASSDSKPVSNITHLVKRKRNVDDILPERAAKQIRQEDSKDESKVASTVSESEAAATEKKPVTSEVQPVASEETPVASEEKPVASEEKPEASEEKTVAPEEKPVESEEKPEPSEEKPVSSEGKALVSEDKPVASEDKAVESEAKPTDESKPTEKSEETKPEVEAKADEKAETAAEKTEAASQGLSVEEEKMEVS